MIRALPDKRTMKLDKPEGEESKQATPSKETLVVQNPLSSSESLAAKKTAQQGTESPILKSLFDIKGNSKYKERENKPKKSFEFENPFRKSESSDRGITI